MKRCARSVVRRDGVHLGHTKESGKTETQGGAWSVLTLERGSGRSGHEKGQRRPRVDLENEKKL